MVDGRGGGCHGAVDAFWGDERGAEEVGGEEGGTEFFAECGGIGECEEAVEGSDGDHAFLV